MTTNPERTGKQWQSPDHVDSWFADKARQADHRRLRAKLVKLLPFEPDAAIRVLDIGAGDGALSLDILGVYPGAQLVCHDFSETMLARARQRLAPFSAQVSFAESDFRYPAWTGAIMGTFDAVVSSVAIHNVTEHARNADHSRVRAIYDEVFGLVKPGGCFLNYDHVFPPGPVTDRIYSKQRIVTYQELLRTETGIEKSFEEVEEELKKQRRNRIGMGPPPDPPADRSPGARTVLDQLEWLKQAGFDEVDCLWKEVNIAIIGAFRY